MEAKTDLPALSVRGLHRSYGTGDDAFEAVRGVDLDVRAGTITALLGTNGAGKTSTLEVIEGLAPPGAGEVRVLGLDPLRDRGEVRRRTGVLLQRSGFSGDLTVAETLRMWATTLSRPRRFEESLALLGLESRARTRVRSLSGGEQRRLDLTCTLMGHPEVVLLDEPTTGLDPESRRDVWRLIEGLRDGGVTVLLTTHYLEEAEVLADRLEIMHAGRIVRSGTPDEITADHPSMITFSTPGLAVPELPAARGVIDEHQTTTVETDDLQVTLTALLGWAERENVRLSGLEARSTSLEAVFLKIAEGQTLPPDPRPDSAHRLDTDRHEGASR